jgi:hypothetical protein
MDPQDDLCFCNRMGWSDFRGRHKIGVNFNRFSDDIKSAVAAADKMSAQPIVTRTGSASLNWQLPTPSFGNRKHGR